MNSIKHSAEFEVGRPVGEVFPLFTPEGEKLWAPGWDYVDVKNARALAEDGIFLTHSHDHAATTAVWLVKRYEPDEHFVQYYKVEPGDKVGIVTVQCTTKDAETTAVQVTYEYIALSKNGRAFVEAFTAEAYERMMAHWEAHIRSYLDSDG